MSVMRRASQKMRMPPASMRTVWYAEAAMWLPEEAGMLFLLIKDNMYMLYIISFLLLYEVSIVLCACFEWYIIIHLIHHTIYKLFENNTRRAV